jgi:hypothetical protein
VRRQGGGPGSMVGKSTDTGAGRESNACCGLSSSLRAKRSNPHLGSGIDGLLRCARNDEWIQVRDLATSFARGLHLHLPSSISEGTGKTGCLLHPRSRVRFAQTKLHTSIQGSGSIPAFPAQWLYGLFRALPGERLFCLRRQRDTSRQLSASTATPEPHDFAVRVRRVRLSRHLRPSHLTARS